MGKSRLEERILTSKSIFTGKIVHLLELKVELPNGKTTTREVVRHPGAVAILAEKADGRIICVEQYRTAPDEVLLEVPAGKLEVGESPESCAVRELEEETGYRANSIVRVGEFFTSPGFADEKIHLYYATKLEQGSMQLDEDEFVHTCLLSHEEVARAVELGSVRDAKTWIAFLWWLRHRESSQ